eukprot:gene10070-biopygen19775
MGREVGPAFQRRSRNIPSSNLGVRLAETPDQTTARVLRPQIRHFDRESTDFASAPRCEPPRARAPGPQMIWMAPGSSLAFQRLSRAFIPPVTRSEQHHTIAGAMMWCGRRKEQQQRAGRRPCGQGETPTDTDIAQAVTESRRVPDACGTRAGNLHCRSPQRSPCVLHGLQKLG